MPEESRPCNTSAQVLSAAAQSIAAWDAYCRARQVQTVAIGSDQSAAEAAAALEAMHLRVQALREALVTHINFHLQKL